MDNVQLAPLDPVLDRACAQVLSPTPEGGNALQVQAFFHLESSTVSYVVHDRRTRAAAIIDSVLDLNLAAGRIATHSAQQLLDYVVEHDLRLELILETHVHADHLTATAWLREKTGARTGIGRRIDEIQHGCSRLFNLDTEGEWTVEAYDDYFDDGHCLRLGSLAVTVLHLPGHTPACVGYLVEDALFVGDTIFMPDFGTARTDFPGGDARQLYRSIRRLYGLPPETRLFMCHDYLSETRREHRWETTVQDQLALNAHVRSDSVEEDFVAMRTRRDATLAPPSLMLPALQINIRGGRLPERESNGKIYLKIPLNA